MATDTQTSLRIDIGVCRKYPGEKLPPGDPRWGQHTHSFVKETHTIESLAKAIATDGYAISAVMKDDHRKGENFISAQHLGLDRDEGNRASSIEGLLQDSFIADHAAIVHETAGSIPDNPRTRAVFILDQPITDPEQYRLAAEALIWKFRTADEQCKDPARLFFGRKNARHVLLGNILYRDVLQEEVIEPYLRAKTANNSKNGAGPIPDAIIDGQRNNTLTSLAGSMRRRGMGEAEILAALKVTNEARCQPPLEDGEVREIACSMMRYEPATAGHTSSGHESTDAVPEQEEIWPERQQLSERPTVCLLPEWMIPAPFKDWARDIAARACVPLEMIACPAINAAGAVVGRQMGIRPSWNDYYLVVPNMWGGVIARPGAMKTYGIEEAIKPLKALAAKARDRYQAAVEANSSRQARIKAEIDAIKSEMVSAAKGRRNKTLDELEKDLTTKQKELQENGVIERRYMTQDATLEKLGELLRDNPRGLLVYRDELAGWLHTLDRAGREGDREFYLEAWNGTGSYTTDRIGRGTIHIPATCISIFGGVQPGKLNAYVREAIAGAEGADGLLQRIQLMVWPDGLGKWEPPDRPPDRELYHRVVEIFEWLDAINPDLFDAEQENGSIPAIRFSPKAQQLFDQWRTELEYRVRSTELESAPAFEAHISKYRSLMPSLALLFHLIEVADGAPPGPVSLAAAQLAASWCDYLEVHAKKVYAAELYPGMEAAYLLAKRIEQGVITDGAKVRDIYALHHWSGLDTAGKVNAALEKLQEAGWVRVEEVETGGRPTQVLRVHPDLRAKAND